MPRVQGLDLVQRCDTALKTAAAALHLSNQGILARSSCEISGITNEADNVLLTRLDVPATWLRGALKR